MSKLRKISVAPGEKGKFQNWGEDIFLEERCFPDLFPFGHGGYLSSLKDEKKENSGFAMYIKHRIMSVDPKFRNNSTYLFFLLLVKELVQLKRCKQTYLRQATKLPVLNKETMRNIKREDLSRYNRSYQVFKSMRGTSMYYEEAKKNVMALIRQNGSPSLFLTLSCAEYSWESLLKQIVETVKNEEVSDEDISKLSSKEKSKFISENIVQSTVYFQRKIEKELNLMTMDKFFGDNCQFSASSYYYRVEFQQRGAPHIHCLVWLEDEKGEPAPTFWTADSHQDDKSYESETEEMINDRKRNEQMAKIKKIESIANQLICCSVNSAMCDIHQNENQQLENDIDKCDSCFSNGNDFEECQDHRKKLMNDDCDECCSLRKMAADFQTHNHTFTCNKKNKVISIKSTEGHGRNGEKIRGTKISEIALCRFNFPRFPLHKTKFILAMQKSLSAEEKNQRKSDLKQIKKFLIRISYNENKSHNFEEFKSWTFLQFLFEVGMFVKERRCLEEYSLEEKTAALERYLNALSASVRGSGSVFLKRQTRDLFTNNFNRRFLSVHKANHDIQIVIDQVC